MKEKDRTIRGVGNLYVETIKPKTESAKRIFLYRGATLWNSLAHEIQAAQTKHTFKIGLKRLGNL